MTAVTASLPVFIVAAAVSLAVSWVFVTRVERLGERFGLTEALVGLVAALGANTPEITTSATALAHGQHDVGAGVVVGSNVFNLAALLGLSALVAGSIALHRRVLVLAGVVATWVAVVCCGALTSLVSPAAALALCCVVFIPYVVVLALRGSRGALARLPAPWRAWLRDAVHEEELELEGFANARPARPVDGLVAVASLVVVVLASIVMERSATTLGSRAGIDPLVLGGIVLAAVTSLPNAVSAVYLARRAKGAAVLSIALNSNSLNVMFGLLVPAIVVGALGGGAGSIGAWFLGMTVGCLTLAYVARGLRRVHGVLIVVAYAAFVVWLVATT